MMGDKYERLLNQLVKENLFLKVEIRRKGKVMNILLKNFSNRVQEHSNYIISKNVEVGTQPDQQIKNNTHTSTASTNHGTIIASAKENHKSQKKLHINQLNSKNCDKIHVN